MKIVLASDNAGKLREFREILSCLGFEMLSKKEAGCFDDIEEKGSTFEENAFLKASFVCKVTGLPALADDSGLCVDALNGAPGVFSARFTGNHSDSDENRCNYLLKLMQGKSNRSARFMCALCCCLPNGEVIRATGKCEGEILLEKAGANGFGYDPLFKPEGYDLSMAQLSSEEKNAISHRGNALKLFIKEWENKYDKQ